MPTLAHSHLTAKLSEGENDYFLQKLYVSLSLQSVKACLHLSWIRTGLQTELINLHPICISMCIDCIHIPHYQTRKWFSAYQLLIKVHVK